MHTMCFVNNIRHIYPYAYYIIDINPPAPKVPRRDSLGAEPIDSNNSLFTGAASAGAVHFQDRRRAKKCTGLVVCTFCRSAQHRPNAPFRSDMAATWAPLGSTSANNKPNFGPTSTHLAPTSAQSWRNLAVGFVWERFRPKLSSTWAQHGDMAGPIVKFSGCGRYSSRSDSNMIIYTGNCSRAIPI